MCQTVGVQEQMGKPLRPDLATFVLIDVQGVLAQRMHDKETLFANLERLLQAMRILHVPILWLEQNPERMGPTRRELQRWMEDLKPISKMAFSCAREPAFSSALRELQRPYVILAGIEAHVCVYQTARDLLADGCGVEVVADAVSSRTASNRVAGLERARAAGARLTTTEMLLFDLMGSAEHPSFREVLALVK